MRSRTALAVLVVTFGLASACQSNDDDGGAGEPGGDGGDGGTAGEADAGAKADAGSENAAGAPNETSGGSHSGQAGAGGVVAVAGAGGQGGAHEASGGSAGTGAVEACEHLGVPGSCISADACTSLAEHHPAQQACADAELECCVPYGLALCDPETDPAPSPNAENTTEAAGTGDCPDGMVDVGAFCIDRFEASLVTVDGSEAWSPFISPSVAVRAVSVAGAVPQAYVDGEQAAQACANAGKRLCTDGEWLRACQGPGTTYPYGDVEQAGACNDHRDEHPAIQYFGTAEAWIFAELGNACLDQLPQTVAPTGSFAGCISSEGALDLAGNLNEWTADPAGTYRGGSYLDSTLNGAACLYATTAHDTQHSDFTTGFRCCLD